MFVTKEGMVNRMGLVIAIYTREAFKEYVMPAVNNADYSVMLNKNYFNLHKDISLDFEVINDIWKIKCSDSYRIYLGKFEIRENTVLNDSEMFKILTIDRKPIYMLIRLRKDVFCAYEKYDIQRVSQITIGEGENNFIRYSYRQLISKEHAEMVRRGQSFVIISRSQNGVYVNAKCITGTEELHFGDYINIYGLHMVFLGNILAIDTTDPSVKINEKCLKQMSDQVEEENGESDARTEIQPVKTLFHRSPRIIEKIETETIEIEEPPKEMKIQKKPLLMTIGPSFTMAIPMLLGALLMIVSSRATGRSNGLFMYSGLVMAVSSASVGIVWGFLNMKYQKKEELETQAHRYEAYSNYLLKKTEEIKGKYTHNQDALNRMYPETDLCLSYDEQSAMLWNRNATHEDYLCCRLGQGDIDFQVPIEIPKEKFRLERDELAEKPEFIENNYKTLTKVPILLNLLEHKLIGVVGGNGKKGAIQVAKIIAAQIAACNCYTDVKMLFIYDKNNSDDDGQWEFAKWLPHVWAEDKKIRYIASNKLEAGEVFYEAAKIFRQRSENEVIYKNNKSLPKPYFVLFLSDPSLIEDELIAKYVFDTESEIGLSTIMLASESLQLPNACEYIVENDALFQGIYNVSAQKEDRIKVQFDIIDDEKMERFSRRLSNIEVQEMETGGEIPNSLTFFEMYGISRPEDLKVEERWLKNRNYDNIRGLIGKKAGGAPCYMDVHEKYHGPHGLVAGTTGSGKSETLQTYMLSLAINYSPDDLGFFIIDYKGGGMANLFNGLPHMIGQISNLSGNQVYRAMVSIKSENRRRQRIFTEHGVNNLNSYTKLYKNKEASVPIPHLFIIIDEFAELKREEPEFMKELISVAQVGRSLGVHLILATQKPSGTVDDNIWSNSKFRLCLRVQDRQDSNDMLHKPDAAYITQAGRCYLQVGNDEVYELFQSGWSGAPYDENLGDQKAEIAKMLTINGKAELTGGHAREVRKAQILRKWITSLVCCLEKTDFCMEGELTETLSRRGNMLFAAEQFYKQIEKSGLDYQKNKYNLMRLEDFIRLYGTAGKMDGETVDNMIHLAEKENVKLPEVKEQTQLDAIRDYLQKIAEKNGYHQAHQLWMPVLRTHIYLNEFAEYQEEAFQNGAWKKQTGEWALSVPAGMVDDPRNQSQIPLVFSFSEGGHHAIIGSVVSGKSTMMQTILYGLITKYTPDYLNIYALDFSSKMMSAFEGAPHFGGVMYEEDREKIAKFFNMIERILNERKTAFRGGNYSQYVQVHGVTYPAIVIAIDNYSAFQEKTEEQYEKLIVQLSKEGVGHGIFLLLSAGGFGMNEIPGRIGENLKTVLCLELPDKFAYADVLHTTQIQVMPETGIKGRGLTVFGNQVLEYQTALALEADDDYQRMEKIAGVCAEMNRAWTGRKALLIPEIPEKPTWEMFCELDEVKKAEETDYLLPVGYNVANAQIYSIDLSRTYCYLITGAAKSGKKNFMKIMIESARMKKSNICVIDGKGILTRYSGQDDVDYVGNEEELFEYLLRKLSPEFAKRNKMKQQILANGGEEEELFAYTRKEVPVFLFITDLMWFMTIIYDLKNSIKGGKGFMETLTQKGSYHNIYFIGLLNLEDKNLIKIYQAFNNFVSYKTGIHFGGNVVQNGLLNFDYMSFKEQTKIEKAGIGILSDMNDETNVQKIVVPLAKSKKKLV